MNYFSKGLKKALRTILLEIESYNDPKDIVDVQCILEKIVELSKYKSHAVSYRKQGLVNYALQQEGVVDKINLSLPEDIRI
jgi:hypothetical protein